MTAAKIHLYAQLSKTSSPRVLSFSSPRRGTRTNKRGTRLEMGKYKLNKIDLREIFEPARLSDPKQTLITKPLDTKPPLGRCYIVTTSEWG